MNKADLVERIAKQTGQTKMGVEETINAAIDIIKAAVKKREDVTLVGFGTFTQTRRLARNGRNPQTGKEIRIPEMTLPRFKPGKEFKSLLS